MTASDARLHLRYSAWASARILAAVTALPAEALTRDLSVSHESILKTLGHLQFADWIWYTRTVAPFDRPAETLESIETAWPDLAKKWITFADALTDADLTKIVHYKSMDGKPFENVMWQVILHVVNHATLHRGQIMAMLRQVGVKPPATDLLFYYRELQSQ